MPLDCQRSVENELLSVLSDDEYQRLLPSFRFVTLTLGQVLHEPNGRLEFIYFPISAIISLVYTMRNGSTAEIGVVGNEGMLGIALVLGGNTMPNTAVTQVGGEAIQMSPRIIKEEFSRSGSLRQAILQYIQVYITQISQTAVCNRLHPMEQRLCRWLLLCQDRAKRVEFRMTQDFIAQMLGSRRESVTIAAGRLHDAGLIEYARGHIRILDRARLRASVCECYDTVIVESDRLRNLSTSKSTQPVVVRQNSSY
jgi:CRP-like cAMP-binding protein